MRSTQHSGSPPSVDADSLCLLAMGPLLLASDNGINGLVLAIATLLVLSIGGLLRAVIGGASAPWKEIADLICAAVTVAALDLALRAWLPLAHAAVAERVPLLAIAALATWQIGARSVIGPIPTRPFPLVVAVLASLPLLIGALRELLAQGSLFVGATGYFGSGYGAFELRLLEQPFDGLLIAQRAPFVFVVLALLLAGIQHCRAPAAEADAA